ncbi:hypothetical protein B9K09_17275 [Pseudomonas sp. M30-35]|nr:hypothetical protein B9K09_17275 [Pseudomonas sp. M30-35]
MLFIFSPHSCEVVKTVFFTLFWRREPQKFAPLFGMCQPYAQPMRHKVPALLHDQLMDCSQSRGAKWATLCGHCRWLKHQRDGEADQEASL